MLRDRRIIIEGLVLPVCSLPCRCDFSSGIERGAAVVDAGLVHDHHVFLGIEDFLLSPGVLPAIAAIIINGSLSLFAGAGGHEDHAVGGTCTVDGGRGGVLQDFDRLDVIGVEVVDTSIDRHSIHNVERVGVVDGADTTDLDLGSGTGLARGLGDLDTGDLALDGIVDGRGADLVEGVAVDLRDGGGYDAFLLDTVTDHDCLVEQLGVIFQDDLQFLLLRDRDRTGHVADAGHFQDSARRDAEGEFTIQAGGRAVAGSLLDHESADNRLAGCVQNNTGNGDALRESRQGQS